MKIETSDRFTSTDDLNDYFLDTRDIVLANINKPMDNLIGYGLQNPNPLIPDTLPFINEHFQETLSFHPNTSYMADSENSFYSDKSVAVKVIIDAQTKLIISQIK
ncbi:hypothetical protein CDAR_45131 [Caerostris darwini]|uniref:DNA-directed RNA polymerase n=1 Tax=Caerostris darwini TaxID=1538125 RepID=A0AAV4W7W6_9ARAC|nr:hypothetical protein CDAR_45131 [Caerostris darwini]